jgi:hypothetical protein
MKWVRGYRVVHLGGGSSIVEEVDVGFLDYTDVEAFRVQAVDEVLLVYLGLAAVLLPYSQSLGVVLVGRAVH